MSELILLLVRGRRWNRGCERLAHSSRLYYLYRTAPNYEIGQALSKPSRPSPMATRQISQQLAWRNCLRLFESHGALRILGLSTRRNIVAVSSNKQHIVDPNGEQKDTRAATAAIFLQQHLDFDANKANECIKHHGRFVLIDSEDISLNYQICCEAGFSKQSIKHNPWILSYPHTILTVKLQFIKNMNLCTIDNAIPFFKLGIVALRTFSEHLEHETIENGGVNRITYLAEYLQCPTSVICQTLIDHYFMRKVPFAKLQQVVKIMLDFHVSRDDILNDVWAFRYSPKIIATRLKKVTDAGVYPVKPWMIRCPEAILSSSIRKAMLRRSVLGDKGTVTEYLSQRLKCDQREITALLRKHPKIAQVSGPKLKQMFDLFLENGYTTEDIFRTIRVLFRKLETIQERLVELEKYGHKPKNLSVLCKSKREYEVHLEMIKLRWIPPTN